DGVVDDEDLDDAGDAAAGDKGDDSPPESGLEPFEIIHHDNRGNGQQVEQVDADGKAHHIEDEDNPAVGAGLIGMVFPFEDGPEDKGGKESRRGVDFAFDGAVPEGVAESIGEGADDAGGHDGKELLSG